MLIEVFILMFTEVLKLMSVVILTKLHMQMLIVIKRCLYKCLFPLTRWASLSELNYCLTEDDINEDLL